MIGIFIMNALFKREREIGGGGGCPRELLDDWWEEGVEELNLVRSHPKVFWFAPHSFF